MDLIERITNLGEPHVVVVGDLMLDRYIWGNAERISQEAPVILLRADRREERLGGASSVATMLRALGARVSLAGVIGDDLDGRRIRDIIRELGIDDTAVLADSSRPSTVKERYIGRAAARHPQQMIRVDYENRSPVSTAVEKSLSAALKSLIRSADVVLISDYDKGVCTPGVLAKLIAECQKKGRRVIADPIRGGDYARYAGCSAITPNRLEAGLATGRTLDSREGNRGGGGGAAEEARPRGGDRHARQGRDVSASQGRPHRHLQDPAAAGVRHHRGRRHGHEHARHGARGGGRLRRGDPARERRRRARGREDRRRHGEPGGDHPRPAS